MTLKLPCVSPRVSSVTFAFLIAEFLQTAEKTAPPPAPQASRGAYADASWSSVPSYTPQPDSTCGRGAGHGESTWSGYLRRGWGAGLGLPAPTAPRACTHQRDPGPGSRRGAVEGRARGGRQSAGQQRPQAEERRKRGGRRQAGRHQGPDSCHGRTETAGLEGHTAAGSRAERSLPRLRSRPVSSSNPASAPAGGAAPAQSPNAAAAQPARAGLSRLSVRAALGRPLPLDLATASPVRRYQLPWGLGRARSVSPERAQGAAGRATALTQTPGNNLSVCHLAPESDSGTAKSRRSDARVSYTTSSREVRVRSSRRGQGAAPPAAPSCRSPGRAGRSRVPDTALVSPVGRSPARGSPRTATGGARRRREPVVGGRVQ